MKGKPYIVLLLFLVSTVGFSQVEFTVKLGQKKIGVNERLRVDFEMNKDGDNFIRPDFNDFTIYGGPQQAVRRSWTNGVSTFHKTYTFFLKPKRRGTLKIGQAEVEIDGKTYKTSPKTVEVTAAVNKPKNGDNQSIDISSQIHLVTEVSNTHPYLNEGITVVYKLYVSPKTSVRQWQAIDNPKFSNFWSQNIDIKHLDVKHGQYQGEEYRYVVLRKSVLYPQKTGKLNIEPLTLTLSVEVPSQRRNIFGSLMYKSVDKTIASKNRTIDVKPLPEDGKPASFTGAVGNFNFKVTTTKNTLNADESLDANVEVSGNGNLKLFQLPKLIVPNALEAYDPQHSENVQTNLGGMRGKITDSYTLVPKMKGKYPINPMSFSYFDPKTETYKTLTSKKLMVNVLNGPSPGAVVSNDSTVVSTQKQRVVSTGKQFRYIKLKTSLQPIDKSPFFKSNLFWILLFLPVIILPVVLGIGKKRRASANDLHGNRMKKANKLARKYLSAAKKNLGDQKAFYDSLELALHNYLKAKIAIQTSEMSKERIRELLGQKKCKDDTITEFISLLESCEFARYTPSSDVEMQQDYDKAAKTISKLDKQL